MTSTAKPPAGGRPGSQQGTAAARAARIAAAKAERERKAKAAKVRNLAIAIGAAVVLAIAAVIVIPRLGGGSGNSSTATPAGLTTYQGITGSADGKATAPVTMVLFEDFQCPVCRQMEETNGAERDSLVASGQIRVIYSMVAFLDTSSLGNRYSTRAANAFYCAPQDQRKALHDAFYKNQPAENTHGKTDAQILAVAKGAGVSSATFSACFTGGTYEGFAASTTSYAENNYGGAQFGTPTMLLNGQLVPSPQTLSPSQLDQYVAAAAAKASPAASN